MRWLVVVAFVFTMQAFSEMRTWTDKTGIRIEGEFQKEVFGEILVKDKQGRSHFIPLENLSESDSKYIQSQIPPEVEIDVKHVEDQLPETTYTRADEKFTMHSFLIEIKKVSKAPYTGQLTVELFVLGDERAKETRDHYVLMHYKAVRFNFIQSDEEVYRLEVSNVLFNSYPAEWARPSGFAERGKEYFGIILAISDSRGNLVAYETDVSNVKWLTDDILTTAGELRELYKKKPGSVEGRHFNNFFINIKPPSIPWFPRHSAF